jgi:hypothetical protein
MLTDPTQAIHPRRYGKIATDEHAACRSVVSGEKRPSLP